MGIRKQIFTNITLSRKKKANKNIKANKQKVKIQTPSINKK